MMGIENEIANTVTNGNVMTMYEKLAISLSIIALLIPIIQLAWNKWIKRPVLKYYPTGKAYLFCNKSGSYIKIEGVFEALRKPISLKSVDLCVSNEKTDNKLNLSWSSICSPVTQSILGAYTSVDETAHPIRIEADHIACAFIEYGDKHNTGWECIKPAYDRVVDASNKLCVLYNDPKVAIEELKKTPEFAEAQSIMMKELYWDIGTYDCCVKCKYNSKEVEFHLKMEVDKEDNEKLKNNIVEILVSPLKSVYHINSQIQVVMVEIHEKS